jgi:putative membrane protein
VDGTGRLTDVDEPTQNRVDYRFLLANERTFLAWSRTALALQVAGLGVLQFLTHAHDVVRVLLGVALVTVGSWTALSGYLRYRGNERAIRAGEDLEAARSATVLTAVVVATPLLAALVLELF